MKRRYLVTFVVSLATLTGCAAMTFKPGASLGATEADVRACRDASTNDVGYVECMRARGWYVSAPGGTPTATRSSTHVGVEPVEPATASDPVAAVAVSGWWKLGAGAADLERATDACVAKLGTEHRPRPGGTVTTALQACLGEAGWHPISQPPSR